LIGNNSGGVELFHISICASCGSMCSAAAYAPAMQVWPRLPICVRRARGTSLSGEDRGAPPDALGRIRARCCPLEVDNSQGELFPGAYTEVHFKLPCGRCAAAFRPTRYFRSAGLMVGTLSDDHHVVLKPINRRPRFRHVGGSHPAGLAEGIPSSSIRPTHWRRACWCAFAAIAGAKPDPNKGKQREQPRHADWSMAMWRGHRSVFAGTQLQGGQKLRPAMLQRNLRHGGWPRCKCAGRMFAPAWTAAQPADGATRECLVDRFRRSFGKPSLAQFLAPCSWVPANTLRWPPPNMAIDPIRCRALTALPFIRIGLGGLRWLRDATSTPCASESGDD